MGGASSEGGIIYTSRSNRIDNGQLGTIWRDSEPYSKKGRKNKISKRIKMIVGGA